MVEDEIKAIRDITKQIMGECLLDANDLLNTPRGERALGCIVTLAVELHRCRLEAIIEAGKKAITDL